MLITFVRDMQVFKKSIEQANGDVWLVLPDSSRRSLKQDSFLLNAISSMSITEQGIRLLFEEADDLHRFNHMLYGLEHVPQEKSSKRWRFSRSVA